MATKIVNKKCIECNSNKATFTAVYEGSKYYRCNMCRVEWVEKKLYKPNARKGLREV